MLNGFPISAKLPDDLGIGERFWYWRGASGQTYIHSIYPAGSCPPLPGAVFLAVRRHGDGRREVLRAGRFPDDWDGPNGAQNLMADEIHVHLLARGDAAAVAVLGDLVRRDGTGIREDSPLKAVQPSHQPLETGVVDLHVAQMRHGIAHIVMAGAGLAFALAHEFGQLRVIQPPRILPVAAVDHIGDRFHPAATADEGDGLDLFEIDHGHLFAGAQIVERRRAMLRTDAEGHAMTGAATVEAQNQARPLGRAAMHMREHAKPAVQPAQQRGLAVKKGKARLPHQRAVAKDPEFRHGLRCLQRCRSR